jgi:formylglycine-generating enzyme required for sulfatase activity
MDRIRLGAADGGRPVSAAPHAVTRPERPYPGLRAFDEDEWMIFFGRERMVDEVVGRLADSRLVLIHGLSGSGKSSLVRAGVLPKLRLQYRRHDAPWLTCAMRPSGGPLWNVAAEFAGLEGRASDLERIDSIAGGFSARSATLASVAASLEGVKGKSLCILVDQFEELFRYEKDVSRDEAELFVDLIKRAAKEEGEAAPDAVDLHVIVTMRSEFLGECARFAGFAETINRTQYLVPRMDDDGLMRAVRRPAQMYGAGFDEALAERLIASVRGREDELPLLQHGLMLMWDDAKKRAAPDERVKLDGAVVDRAGNLPELLSAHADRVMAEVAPDDSRARIVERVFRALTDVNAEGAAVRRPLAFDKLCAVVGASPEKLRPILNAFRAPGVSFVTPYEPRRIENKTQIDISHEALIRCWRKINDKEDGWLQKEIRDGLGWRTLLYQADTFARHGSDFLSERLTEWGEKRLEWRNEAWAGRYGDGWTKVKRLVEASRKHWRAESEKEEARRQEELENERLRREAAEHKAREEEILRDKERLRAEAAERESRLDRERAVRSRLVAILVGTGAAIVIAAFAIWSHQIKEAAYWWQSVRALTAGQERALKPGDPIKECSDCPEMVVLPLAAQPFKMGSPEESDESERPQHDVKITRAFAVAKFQLTFEEWDACAAHGDDCNPHVGDAGWGRGKRPAINVSWEDAQTYVKWLSSWTGRRYRLLSEAEYEYATRAGSETKYPWGSDIQPEGKPMANCDGCGSGWGGKQTAPVGSFPANAFGLYDMVGNVWEWTEDCWKRSYEGEPPRDGAPWLSGHCNPRVVRGGSWSTGPGDLRSANRDGVNSDYRGGDLGFRVARTLTP